MSATRTLLAFLFVWPLRGSEGMRHLGYCTDYSTDCEWTDYLRDVLLQGLFGWVVAVVVLVVLVLYVCSAVVCCFYRWCCHRHPQMQVGHQLWVYDTIRILAWVALLIAGAGLAVSLVGWVRVSDCWTSAWAIASNFTTSLVNLTNLFETEVLSIQQLLALSSSFLSLPELQDAVSSDVTASTTRTAQNVNRKMEDVHDIADLAFVIYCWTIVGFFAATVLMAILFALVTLWYKVLRWCSCWLILLGLGATFLVWLSVGVVVVAQRLLSDVCVDLSEVISDTKLGTSLLSELACDPNDNSFDALYDAYNQGMAMLNDSFCTAVAETCRVGSVAVLSSCTCRSDGDTERFLNDTLVYGDPQCPTNGIANCSVAACATRCSRMQYNISAALAGISSARATLLKSEPTVGLLRNCQIFVDRLFRPVEALCGGFKDAVWLLIAGQIVLGAAGLLCITCLVVVECWLRSHSPVVVVPLPLEVKGIVIEVHVDQKE